MCSYPHLKVNPDLSAERARSTFDTNALAAFVHGGQDVLAKRVRTRQLYESLSELHEKRPPVFMSREERVENAIEKMITLQKVEAKLDPDKYLIGPFEVGGYLHRLTLSREIDPFGLHRSMFIPSLRGQLTEDQKEKWLPSWALLNPYGTNLRKLETTATFDQKRQEFILNTPTITASKWWPGNLGKVTNHAIVMAQLWTRGKCYGPHGFIVQIRDLQTHMPMPGIELYDIGPKFGYNPNDNGCMIMKNVRIPRENMLMKNSKVLPNGEYVAPPHSKLSYGAMVVVRSVMIVDQARSLAIAATIGTRYSCVRRQGEINPREGEVKVLDYQTQQYRVMPEMAKAYAYWFAGKTVRSVYFKVMEEMNSGNFELLPQLHALSSGLKSVVTWEVAQGIEQCRLACGGHGYMHASGLPELYGNTVGGCTYEGDNIVLLLQVARFLIKAGRSVLSGQQQSGLTEYLSKKGSNRSQLSELLEFGHLLEAFEHVARRKVLQCVADLERLEKTGYKPGDAKNRCSVELCKAARAHVRVFLVKNFMNTVQTIPDQQARGVMVNLCRFFTFHLLYNRAGQFMEDGYLNAKQLKLVGKALYDTMELLRPNAVALSDSWDFADQELRSVLGRYDGQVYPNMLEWVKHSNLNKTEVLDSFKKYLAPAMKEARAKL